MARPALRQLPAVHRIDGCTVRVEPGGLSVEPPQPFPPHFELRNRARARGMRRSWTSGDPMFDAGVFVEGEERWLAARFGEKTRAEIRALASLGTLVVAEGVLRMRAGEAAVAPAIAVAVLLSEDLDVPKATAENARRDPIGAVRRRCLEIAIRDHAATSRSLAADLLGDLDPEVRLMAARHIGPKAVGVLRALVTDPSAFDRVRAGALGSYVQYETFDEARSVLADLFRQQRPELMAALAKAMGQIGGDFEPALIAILASGNAPAQIEATIALGQLGTVASVEALQGLVKRSDTSDALRTVARRTVMIIQSAARGEVGRLSISGSDGGEVSLDDEER